MKKLNRLSTIIALILIATFILPSTAVIAAANDSNLVYFYGDLNANGEIDEFDYLLVKRGFMATLELDPDTFLRGDVNGNGKLDIYDYLLVKRHVMGTYTIPMVPLCEHEIESIKAKDATCDENGNIAYFYCVKCEKCYSDAEATNEITPESTVIAAKGHDYTELKNDETAHWKECACGEKSERTSHTFGAWATVVESTCTAQGTRMRVCIACGYIASEKLPLLEHTYGDWLNDTENHWKECVCGNKFGASTHTYGEWETVTEPTCTETGVKKRNCTICGYSQTDSISVVAHTYGEWETVTEPTCTEQGTKKRDCVDCGHTETDVIAMLPHSYDKTNYNSSTHWKECVCGEKIETASHTYGEWETVTEPTCAETGVKKRNCTICEYSQTDSISVVAHTYTDVVTPPTESERGFTTHTCNVCGHSYKDSYVKPTASVGLAYTVNDDGITCTVTGIGTCKDTELIIPSKIDGYKVTSIGKEAFDRCYNLTSITIPDSVTLIGFEAFAYCNGLASITIPDGVTSIGEAAFYFCISLTSITLPDSVTLIRSNAFQNCSNLTSVTIGNSISSIGDFAFNSCSNLKDVYYAGSQEKWKQIKIGSSNSRLTSATIHYNYKNASSGLLYDVNNDGITCTITGIGTCKDTDLVIPSEINGYKVTLIGDCAFYECKDLTSIIIPDSVTSIGWGAFAYCSNLTSVTIGNGVTSIGDRAFYHCYNLTSITIPDSVTSIGDEAFAYCFNLKYVYYAGSQEEWKQIEFDFSTDSSYATIHYNCKTTLNGWIYSANKDATTCAIEGIGTYTDAIVIPSEIDGYKVTVIGDSAFAYCFDLTSITIPDSVTSIGDCAFAYCTGLTSVTIGNGVTSIGHYAFGECDNLTSINIPDNVTSIGSGAFAYCDNLTTVTIGNSVTSIGDSAFEYCTSLTSVTIGNGVTSIGDRAFALCDNLKDVYYAGSQEEWEQIEIGSENSVLTSATIHYNCNNASSRLSYDVNNDGITCTITGIGDCGDTDLIIPSEINGYKVTSIGDYAFSVCTSLTSITIPDNVTSIGYEAFYNCTSLTSVTIGNNVTSIGDSAFRDCYGLTTVTIGNGVTSIGDLAFYYCDNLTTVTIGNGVTSIGNSAFEGCTSLTSINIPDSVTSIGDLAFYECSSLKYNVYDNAYYLGNANNPYVVLVQAISEDITSCTINPNTKSIHSDAFYRCTSLTSIIIPDSVTSIGNRAFAYCTGLTSVTIGNGVTSISFAAFSNCTSLTSINIPDSVTSIGDYALYGCSNLEDVYYAGSQEEWDQIEIGAYNYNLTSATIHYNSK